MNKILNHWLNGRTIEWIANREGVTVEQVNKAIRNEWRVL